MNPLLVGALAAAMFIPYCRPSDGCPLAATRCVGNVVELCDADARWHELADCDLVSRQSGAESVCREVQEETPDGVVEGHTCVRAASVGVR